MTIKAFKNALPVLLLLSISHIVISQSTEITQPVIKHFGGAVTVTNNGISFIPKLQPWQTRCYFRSVQWVEKNSVLNRSSVLPWKENPGQFFSGGDINY